MTPLPLAIRLFGPLCVMVGGEPLPRVRAHSVEGLLPLLVLRHGRAVDRAWLAGTLWPESSGSRALQNLRNDLVALRKALGPEGGRIQSPGHGSLTLDLAGAAVDVLQFDAAIRAGDEESLRSAVQLYTGPLLEGCVEEWAFSERSSRAEQLLAALETLAERAEERGGHDEAIRYLRRAEALDPLRDSIPRRLMASLAAAGDPAAAIQTYRDFRLRLQEELAAVPDEATTHLFHEIRAAARRPAVQRRLAPVSSPATGDAGARQPVLEPLPRPLTSLVGRDQEVQQVQEALRESFLVTLVGGGGVGKTRLALEVAGRLAGASPDGAAWVELAPLADGALVLPSVAVALGLRDAGAGEARFDPEGQGRGPDPGRLDAEGVSAGGRAPGGAGDPDALTCRLVARLTDGAPLLVLDNCEHVLDAAAALVRTLLQRCPELRVLATSQQRLGLPGEIPWRVPSLSVPGVPAFRRSGGIHRDEQDEQDGKGPDANRDPVHPGNPSPASRVPDPVNAAMGHEHLMRYSAARLFVERAAAVHPGFRLASDAEAAAVGLICRRLDGIPLAIELAAARVRVLTPQQIAARLDDRFKLLTGGARGALPRHQTLRALIDWSCDGLPPEEATLLRRLSVFAGGWTLEAAEAVGSADKGGGKSEPVVDLTGLPTATTRCAGTPPLSTDVLDLLDALVDRSLVLVDEAAAGLRYRLLETVREYAGEKLVASGERTAARDRHRDWHLQLAAQSDAAAHGPEQTMWLLRLEADLDNFRAALTWCFETVDSGQWAVDRAATSKPGVPLPMPLSELTTDHWPLLTDVAAAAEAGLRLSHALWWLWMRRGYLAEGLQWMTGALARGSEAPASIRAPALFRAAHLASGCGRRDQSRAFLQSARQEQEKLLALARAEGDRRDIAHALLGLAEMAREMDDMDAAGSYAGEARPLLEAPGDRNGLIRAMDVMAGAALWHGDREAGRRLLEERLAICRELGASDLLIQALGAMGHFTRDGGDYARARSFYAESLVLRREMGYQLALAQSLEDLAALAGREGQTERAVRLLGAGEAFCETLGVRPPVAIAAEYERTVAEGRAALGEAAFAAAWAAGRAMSLEQAVAYALGDI
jgi:predicted ATPase/DNA-binding SARP family transcriptional activator